MPSGRTEDGGGTCFRTLGDVIQLKFMLENLIDEAPSCKVDGGFGIVYL